MAPQNNGTMAGTKYQGLPGDEAYARRTYDECFEEFYGKGANAETLYRAQVNNFTRFAKVHPRVAFLLEQLQLIYDNLDASLDIFKLNYGLAAPDNTLSRETVRFRGLNPFVYFSSDGVAYEHRSCLLHLRAALDKWNESSFGPLFREVARDIVHDARTSQRKAIVEELLSYDGAAELHSVPVAKDAGIWAVRRDLARQEETLTHNLQRIEQSLDRHDKSNEDVVEYLGEPVARFAPNPDREYRRQSPDRRHHSPRRHHRSISRGSVAPSSVSITTYAPEEPDLGTLSIKVWSATKGDWVECLAVMDTGCEGGNFVSSAFLSEHLGMHEHVVNDDDSHRVQWVDIGGKTDFKPSGKIQLKWYGRDIQSGRKGKRTGESFSWFHVAPHLGSDSGEQPFQILLGKDFLHENEIVQYRGLRLYKSKVKKNAQQMLEEQAETLRRQQQRQDLDLQRRGRVSIDGTPSLIPSLSSRNSGDDISFRSEATSSNGHSPMMESTVGD